MLDVLVRISEDDLGGELLGQIVVAVLVEPLVESLSLKFKGDLP